MCLALFFCAKALGQQQPIAGIELASEVILNSSMTDVGRAVFFTPIQGLSTRTDTMPQLLRRGFCRLEFRAPATISKLPKHTFFRLVGDSVRDRPRIRLRIFRRLILEGGSSSVQITTLCYADHPSQLTNDIIAASLSHFGTVHFRGTDE